MKLIIITGPSGSGKTTLAKKLNKQLNNAYTLSTDNFYKTGIVSNILSKFIKSYFDKNFSMNNKLINKTVKEILNNKKIDYLYIYDFKKKKIKKVNKKSTPIDNLIIEGIFALDLLKLFSSNDYLIINLNIKKNLCRERIFVRDQNERGKDRKTSLKNFQNAWRLYRLKDKFLKNIDKRKIIVFEKEPELKKIIDKLIKSNY